MENPIFGPPVLRVLGQGDSGLLRLMQGLFGEVFEDPEFYTSSRPSEAYHESLLASRMFIAIAAIDDGSVVGGLVAYEIPKFERETKEIYLYDIGVASSHQRQGLATAMIRELQSIAACRNASVIFVQAHAIDAPAVALYSGIGIREEVFHFDIQPLQ